MQMKDKKIVVFDDDPTGTQTVHHVSVLTAWDVSLLEEQLLREDNLFFILTNSRSLSAQASEALHREMMNNLLNAALNTKVDIEVISRSDSTLRGHYPLEVDVIRDVFRSHDHRIDGEFIIPFFGEGGRLTMDDMHLIRDKSGDTPVSETEFAQDNTFGFKHSNLKDWIEEKTEGQYQAASVESVSLELLRLGDSDGLRNKLLRLREGQKCIVNAETYEDIERFDRALKACLSQGRNYIYRTAASFVRIHAGISSQPLLNGKQVKPIESANNKHGALMIVGSHVQKTTEQLKQLLAQHPQIEVFEINVEKVIAEDDPTWLSKVASEIERAIQAGRNCLVYTSRTVFKAQDENREKHLAISVKISEALVSLLEQIKHSPRYLLAKGGITSSDLAVKALKVKRADVLGQILPGVSVWRTGKESKFSGLPYIVFPGNVGDADSLCAIYRQLD